MPEGDAADMGVLHEAVFEELGKTEQLEFYEIDKKLKQRKARRAATSEKVEAKAKAKPRKRKAQPANARAKRRRAAEEPAAAEEAAPQYDEAAEGRAVFAAEDIEPMPPPVPAGVPPCDSRET